MSAHMLAFGQVLAAADALTNASYTAKSATSTIARCLWGARPEPQIVDRIREDAAALRALADTLDAAVAELTPAIHEAA